MLYSVAKLIMLMLQHYR